MKFRTWRRRLIWILVYIVVLRLLPETTEEAAAVLLRETVVREIFSSWSAQVEEYGRLSGRLADVLLEDADPQVKEALKRASRKLDEGSLTGATEILKSVAHERGLQAGVSLGEIFHSFLVGSNAYPGPPPVRLPFSVHLIYDHSGAGTTFGRQDLVHLLRGSAFAYLEVVEDGGSNQEIAQIDVLISRTDGDLTAKCDRDHNIAECGKPEPAHGLLEGDDGLDRSMQCRVGHAENICRQGRVTSDEVGQCSRIGVRVPRKGKHLGGNRGEHRQPEARTPNPILEKSVNLGHGGLSVVERNAHRLGSTSIPQRILTGDFDGSRFLSTTETPGLERFRMQDAVPSLSQAVG